MKIVSGFFCAFDPSMQIVIDLNDFSFAEESILEVNGTKKRCVIIYLAHGREVIVSNPMSEVLKTLEYVK